MPKKNYEYYNCEHILTVKDINGLLPRIIICCSLRGGGKTTDWQRKLLKRFLTHGEQTLFLFRTVKEYKHYDATFGNVVAKYFPDVKIESRKGDSWNELWIGNKCFAFVGTIKNSKDIKTLSNVFNNVRYIFFDEFLAHKGKYLADEVDDIMSIYSSVARGWDNPDRFVQLIMCGNIETLINPYFERFGLASRIQNDTKVIRGDGFVFEMFDSETIRQSHAQNSAYRALGGTYNNVVLGTYMSSDCFIGKPENNDYREYFFTLRYRGKEYGVKRYRNFYYVDDKPDQSCKRKVAASREDMTPEYLTNGFGFEYQLCKKQFDAGLFRFKNFECKDAFFRFLSI